MANEMEPKQPLAEVFGFPATDQSKEAKRHRKHRLCPFNNNVPNCTKDKVKDPLGVCSVNEGNEIAITCPVRFRQGWIIADDAADFFFPPDTKWTTLTEVRLTDRDGKSAGNIDVVLVAYDERGKVFDFGALEVQAVYISGNVRNPFEYYMEDPAQNWNMDCDAKSFTRDRIIFRLHANGSRRSSFSKVESFTLGIRRPLSL